MRFRRMRTDGQTGVEHDRRRLVVAADWAITSAWRRRDSGAAGPVWVTVEDVRTELLEQFGLEVPAAVAAAALRERFELRGAGLGMMTDAFEVEV